MMSQDAVDKYDAERADEINRQFHSANEIYQVCMLLSVQIALLQDIRFYLQNADERAKSNAT